MHGRTEPGSAGGLGVAGGDRSSRMRGLMIMRQRVAALIERDGQLLVVRQRARGLLGRHDGDVYLTPPGGGVETGESLFEALVREVQEEVGLVVTEASLLSRIDHTGGNTALFETVVQPGEPVLGLDPENECLCPRLVGLQWVPAIPHERWCQPGAGSRLKVVVSGPSPNAGCVS